MLDRTRKRMGHVREREVGGGRRGKREQTGKVSTVVDSMSSSFLHVCYE